MIAREAFGQPLFVATLVHFVCQSASRTLPTLDEVVRSSVGALSPRVQDLVATVAVAGAPLARDVLSRALKLDGDALQRAIDEAMATQWFHVSSSEDGSGLELVHDRVREALLSRLSSEHPSRAGRGAVAHPCQLRSGRAALGRSRSLRRGDHLCSLGRPPGRGLARIW